MTTKHYPKTQPMALVALVEQLGKKDAAELLGCAQESLSAWLRNKECPKMAEVAAQGALDLEDLPGLYICEVPKSKQEAFTQFCQALRIGIRDLRDDGPRV